MNNKMIMESFQLQLLQNVADDLELKVNVKHAEDKRKTVIKYFASRNGTSVSPVLDYDQMNHFLLGWLKCTKNNIQQTTSK